MNLDPLALITLIIRLFELWLKLKDRKKDKEQKQISETKLEDENSEK